MTEGNSWDSLLAKSNMPYSGQGHGDHIGGLDRLQEVMGCPVRCHPKLEPALTHRLGAGCVVKLRSRELVPAGDGVSLRALFTPGHEDDHVAYYLAADKVLFSGDNILGNSSSSIRNLKQYMASLEIMARQKPSLICPGHGQIIHNGAARMCRPSWPAAVRRLPRQRLRLASTPPP